MPPWKPDTIDGAELVGTRRLTDAEIALIDRWVADGAPEGASGDLPPAPTFAEGWRLGQPDAVVSMTEPYVIDAGGPDQLRNFVIPLRLPRGRYVRGLEFRPDNPRVVHHANIRVDRTGSGRANDAADPEPGFDGRLSGGAEFPDGQFLGWTPGQLPPLFEGDCGMVGSIPTAISSCNSTCVQPAGARPCRCASASSSRTRDRDARR